MNVYGVGMRRLMRETQAPSRASVAKRDAGDQHRPDPTLSATCPAPPPQAPVGGTWMDEFPDVTDDREPDLPCVVCPPIPFPDASGSNPKAAGACAGPNPRYHYPAEGLKQ